MTYILGEKYHEGLPGYDSNVSMPVGVGYEHTSTEKVLFWIGHGNSSVSGYMQPVEATKNHVKTCKRLQLAGCRWFLPYIERMARGEEVSLEEIKQAYRDNNNGREPEVIS